MEEQVVQEFPHRCPYCDGILRYDPLNLKSGENEIVCPSCHRIFVRVVPEPAEAGTAPGQPFPRKGR